MRIVVALGGNALLKRGEALTAEAQRSNIRVAAGSLAPVAAGHELLITHGNGPQVGLLALQSIAYKADEAFPLDVLGAESEGMIGYMIEQELRNRLPAGSVCATLLTMVEVDRDDPAFRDPAKFVGPVYGREEAERLAAANAWEFRQDGAHWRRVVPSPAPRRIVELRPIRWLMQQGAIVICAGGGGIPVICQQGATHGLLGVEAVIDKDLCSELLARELEADLFVMLTDVDAVYLDWGQPTQRAIRQCTPAALAGIEFAPGSMRPKIMAACQFALTTGKRAAIGALAELEEIIRGQAGTSIFADDRETLFHETAST